MKYIVPFFSFLFVATAQIPAPSVIYVGNGFRTTEAYYFYTNNISASNNSTGSVDISNLDFYEGNTYTFERLDDISPVNNHPFALSDGMINGSYHFGSLSLDIQTTTNLEDNNGGIVNGESFSITIPSDYANSLYYYCANPYHTEMLNTFSMAGDPNNLGLSPLDVSQLIITEIDFNNKQVEVTNFGENDGVLSDSINIVLDGSNITTISSGTIMGEGESIVVPLSALGSSGDVWLLPSGSTDGSNYVSNSTFDSDISGWATGGGNSGTLTYNPMSEVLELLNFNSGSQYWHSQLLTDIGIIDASQTYNLSMDLDTDSTGTLRIFIRPTASGAWADRFYFVDQTISAGFNNINVEIPLNEGGDESVMIALQVGALNGTYIDIDNVVFNIPVESSDDVISGLIYGNSPSSYHSYILSAVDRRKWSSEADYVSYPNSTGIIRLMALDAVNPDYWLESSRDIGSFYETKDILDLYSDITTGNISIGLHTLTSDLSQPMGMVDPNDGTGRLFVYEQTGKIKVLNSNLIVEVDAFLDISNQLYLDDSNGVINFWEEYGLLGVALAPDFSLSGRLYLCASFDPDQQADFVLPDNPIILHHSVIIERIYSDSNLNGYFDKDDGYTEREILRVEQPAGEGSFATRSNHNSGRLEFDQNGYLLISFGDGGNSADVGNGHSTIGNGQDASNIHGSIIRIDPLGNNSENGKYGIPVDNPFINETDKLNEIYAYGFRNPWTISVDVLTGDIYSPDSGELSIQELNLIHAGGNYGWRAKEGSYLFDPVSKRPSTLTDQNNIPGLINPIAEYDQNGEFSNIIGGFVYRGDMIPELKGKYICGDYGSWNSPGNLIYLDDSGETNQFKKLKIGFSNRGLANNVRVFAQDAMGEIYFVGLDSSNPSTGILFKIVPLVGADLNFNENEVNVYAVGDEDSSLSLTYGQTLELFDSLSAVNFSMSTNISYQVISNGFFKVQIIQ